MPIQAPKSTFLRWQMGWMIAAVVLKLVLLFQTDNQTAERVVAKYLAGLVFIYVFGAFWSEFPLVYVPAMIAAAVFLIAVLTRGPQSKSAAKAAFVVIMYLSLFCIWIEPWLTPSGLITFVLLAFLRLTTTVVDIGVTIAWLFFWAGTTDAINREL
jgi:hypothetical protein